MDYQRYVDKTIDLLKEYRAKQKSVATLERQYIEYSQENATLPAASIASYDEAPSYHELVSVVENYVERSCMTADKLKEIELEYRNEREILAEIDTALACLTDKEHYLITSHYVDGVVWGRVAERVSMSRKWCSICGNNALLKVALILFGAPERLEKWAKK